MQGDLRFVSSFWVIRQKSTGYYLPAVRGCYTRYEPMASHQMPPRLHVKRSAANLALKAWLGGEQRAAYDFEGSWEGMRIFPIVGRSADDMEIVELHLTEIK